MTISMFFRAHSLNHTPPFPNPTKTHFLSPQNFLLFYKKTPLKNSINADFSCSSSSPPVVVGLAAADSGCGKTTFMKKPTSTVFNASPKFDHHQIPEYSNGALITETTTVVILCLDDDYHLLDRKEYERKEEEEGVTALDHPTPIDFDLIFQHIKALFHPPPMILIDLVGRLHPLYDARVRDLLDFCIYLDISSEVLKFSGKIQVIFVQARKKYY